MTAPLINKRVRVTGTSREELNGKLGVAFGFDYDKNRYNVRLDSGKEVSLQPNNLEAVQGPSSGAGGIPSMPNMQASSVHLVFVTYPFVGCHGGRAAGVFGRWQPNRGRRYVASAAAPAARTAYAASWCQSRPCCDGGVGIRRRHGAHTAPNLMPSSSAE